LERVADIPVESDGFCQEHERFTRINLEDYLRGGMFDKTRMDIQDQEDMRVFAELDSIVKGGPV